MHMAHMRRNLESKQVFFYYGVGEQFSVTDKNNLHDFPFNSPDLRECFKYTITWRSKHELSVLQ